MDCLHRSILSPGAAHRGVLCLALALGLSQAAAAHEFWVEPQPAPLEVGDRVIAHLRVGAMMKGRSFPYLSHRFVSFTVTDEAGVHDILANEGDDPAVDYEATTAGLHIIAHHTTADTVTFDEFDTFAEYLNEEGLGQLIDRHRERGLPESGFTEAYTRNAKALVQIGPVRAGDQDRATGLPFELVAQENPYSPSRRELPVQLLWQGSPAADAQIAIFRKDSLGDVTRHTVRTDAAGNATVSLVGGGQFLLSSVHMEEAEETSGAVWQSHWASLTFGPTNE